MPRISSEDPYQDEAEAAIQVTHSETWEHSKRFTVKKIFVAKKILILVCAKIILFFLRFTKCV